MCTCTVLSQVFPACYGDMIIVCIINLSSLLIHSVVQVLSLLAIVGLHGKNAILILRVLPTIVFVWFSFVFWVFIICYAWLCVELAALPGSICLLCLFYAHCPNLVEYTVILYICTYSLYITYCLYSYTFMIIVTITVHERKIKAEFIET